MKIFKIQVSRNLNDYFQRKGWEAWSKMTKVRRLQILAILKNLSE